MRPASDSLDTNRRLPTGTWGYLGGPANFAGWLLSCLQVVWGGALFEEPHPPALASADRGGASWAAVKTVQRPALLFACVSVVVIIATCGCGLHGGHKSATQDCGTVGQMTQIKMSMDTLDRKI